MIHGNACLAYFNKMWDISMGYEDIPFPYEP